MDELIKQVAQRTGISEEQARTAVNTVLGFLKERLPSPLAGQVDNVLNSGAGAPGGSITDKASDVIGDLGSMFGNK